MISILALIMGGCLITVSQNTGYMDVFVLITIALYSGGLVFDVQKSPVFRKYAVPLAAAYLFRILLLMYDVYTDDPLGLPLIGGPLSVDHRLFYEAAIGYTQGIQTTYGGIFPRLLGAVFSITGASRLWAEFIVFLFSIFTIFAVIYMVDQLDIPISFRRKGVYLIGLLPNYGFLSVVIRRETIITFFLALSIGSFIQWVRGNNTTRSFLLAYASALGASLFHGATGLIVVSYLFVQLIYSPIRKTYTIETRNMLATLISFLVFLFIYARFGTVFFGKIESKLSSGVFSTTSNVGGSSYARYVGDAKTPLRMLIYTVPRLMYFMFSPFPWQWRGLGDVITFLFSSCVYLVIILNSIRYIRVTEKSNENRNVVIALLIVLLLSSLVFSWGVTNTGTATRHRDKFIAIYAVLFAMSQNIRPRIHIKRN